MTTAVLQTSHIHLAISTPFHIQRPDPMAPDSPSRAADQSSRLPSSPPVPEKTFRRLRSSLEQSLRSATRSRAFKLSSVGETGTLIPKQANGSDKVIIEHVTKEHKSKSNLLKVPFRRSGRNTPSPLPPAPAEYQNKHKHKNSENVIGRSAGFTSSFTPSLRQASLSSPALHLYSDAVPAPYVQPAELVLSSSNIAGLVSPTRDRKKPSALSGANGKDISAPVPLSPRSGSNQAPREAVRQPRSPKPRPPPLLPTSPSTPSLETTRSKNSSPLPQTPTPKYRDKFNPPESPTPHPRRHPGGSQAAAASTSQLNLNSPAPSPTPRTTSPIRTRSPSTRQPPPSPSSSTFISTSPPDNVKRRSLESQKPRRPSFEAQRPSGISSRTTSPTPIRPRNFSPSYAQSRHFNVSTTSLSSSANPEHRELVRNAASILCRELLKPPGHNSTGLGIAELEEIEIRMRALARSERIWGKSSAGSSSNIMLPTSGLSSSGLSAAGEDREKRLFSEALRDGYVLCQLMNKVRPGSITRVDKREDGVVRTSNVTKFLASCTTLGLSSNDLFLRDDLIEGSFDSLARVARTIVAVIQISENPPPSSKYLRGRSPQDSGPYNKDSISRGTMSTPNLTLSQARQRSVSPTTSSTPIPIPRKRWSPTAGLPPVFSNESFDSGIDGDFHAVQNGSGKHGSRSVYCDHDDGHPIPNPPPRSPYRPKPSSEQVSPTDSNYVRQSVASTNVTDTTTYSSLLEVQRNNSSQNKFGTIRTVTTEATSFIASEIPSFTRTEASSIADEIGRKRSGGDSGMNQRERKPSETAIVDLSRVAEETEESGTSSRGKGNDEVNKLLDQEAVRPKVQKTPAIRLGKGKWPDDFFDAVCSQKSSQERLSDLEDPFLLPLSESSKPITPLSVSPPRKVAIVGKGDDSSESRSQFPRRPSHRARHSVDTQGLLPKETGFRRDSSPDDRAFSPTSRVMLRRNSTQTGVQRTGVYLPRRSLEENQPSQEGDSQVPFPRAVSGDHGASSLVKVPSEKVSPPSSQDKVTSDDRPRQPRGRFQSEVDGVSSRRSPRPSSYDELGANPRRSRFESMVNLGVASGNASASDLLSRNSLEGTSVRQTLIVREDGKAATQFQLGNCIGRGQFGAVYRALNLNTGQMVAVKRISLSGLKEEEISQLMKEVDLLKSLSHPGIVKYEGMARDQDTLSIVLEYAENGSLGQTLKAFGKLNERLVASYVVKILEGLHYLHQSDVVHCDLKAANILTTKNGNVKLSDFGVSLNLRAMGREMKDVAGTPNWMAPEIIELKGASPKSDIWSLACTVIELLTGRPPYAEIANGMSVMFRIVEDVMPPLPEGISEPLADFLKHCLNKDPLKRPDADILCEHEWLKQNWGLHKELRPQDSIPFLRRVSTDLHKTTAAEAVRFLGTIDQAEPEASTREEPTHVEDPPVSPTRLPNNDPESISPREHSFVKTTFGKPVICRVCLFNIKRTAVLCDQCSLIAHSKCAPNAPPTCNLRAQLLLYAQYADKGTPPTDILGQLSTSPTSDGGYTSRTSLDRSMTPQPSPSQGSPLHHPPTAFKIKSAFNRSRSFLTPDPGQSSSTTSLQVPPATRERKISKRTSFLLKRSGRTQSTSSNNTSTATSSMRSAVTATESLPRKGAMTDSVLSEDDETDPSRLSRMTGYSMISAATATDYGELPRDNVADDSRAKTQSKKRDSKSSNGSGCVVQ